MLTETLFVFVDTGFGDVVVAGQFTLDHQDEGALKRGGRFKYANSELLFSRMRYHSSSWAMWRT